MLKLPFLDRADERSRLQRAFRAPAPSLVVVYGRRRSGKSRLLRETCGQHDVYYLADTRETPLQISAASEEIRRVVPGFSDATYASWTALLAALGRRTAGPRLNLIIDEFPGMAHLDPTLPGTLQKIVDDGLAFGLALCGSSQRMMHGLVLDAAAPLFGRASEILKLRPLLPGWLRKGLGLTGPRAVEAYAVWGGMPRYWELAAGHRDTIQAAEELVLDRNGVLHEEPQRLLLDDMRSATQPHSLLSLIASGCHRLSELAGRLGKPAVGLARPLEILIDLGYVRREVPFGEDVHSTKRSLYRIDDPFIAFWYRFVMPNRSALELGRAAAVLPEVKAGLGAHVAEAWEQLCRQSTAFGDVDGVQWKPGQRWWGVALDSQRYEVDVVAESVDGRHILLGEAKWGGDVDVRAECARLKRLAGLLPAARGREVHVACWVRHKKPGPSPCCVRDAEDVVRVMV